MIRSIFVFANIPEITSTVIKNIAPIDIMIMTGNMFADLIKDFRLFSELYLYSSSYKASKHIYE